LIIEEVIGFLLLMWSKTKYSGLLTLIEKKYLGKNITAIESNWIRLSNVKWLLKILLLIVSC